MSSISQAQVSAFLGEFLSEPLEAAGLDPTSLDEDLDLHAAGIIDSLGLIEVIAAVEEQFGIEVDFEHLDPERLTVVGPFCDYVAEQGVASS